ncbi:hypothetical protein [Streptomyces sp. TLI_171]|uniref:hypothetical protein n=1 Tax=Streptomyces sp. TLI_171 TaxID=1938859 RepID=UPI000C605F40|nr:hypothetical protein [Streptomyces sp. TLI_171]RKE23257.1 hypothetical protein BX266_6719 [Streptomyces sp. TLI_171]
MTGIEDAGPAVLQPCPSCGLGDQVSGVPAVYHAGRDSVRVTRPARHDEGEETVTRSVTTSLSGALAPAPTLLPFTAAGDVAGGVLLVLVAIGTFIGGAAGGHWFSEDSEPTRRTTTGGWYYTQQDAAPAHHSSLAFLGWISALALLSAITLLVRAGRRQAARKLLLAGRAEAERLWSQGWYCRRCGSVHFRARPGEKARALTLQEFRSQVWEAGGYGSLAERGTF